MPTHSSRLLPGPSSHPTTPRRATAPTSVATQPGVIPTAEAASDGADALAVLRRLCPLADVLDAIGSSETDLAAWTEAGLAWPLYVHPGSETVLVDPAVVLAEMTMRCAA